MAAEAKQEEQKVKSEEKAKSNRKRKKAFIYGNYESYYGYRIDRNVTEDPRLAVFKREWFEGKDCLDIGCNQGLITIAIAKKFQCHSIVGIDIDDGLIRTACSNLRKVVPQTNVNKENDSNISKGDNIFSSDSKKDLFRVVSFRCENFVERSHCSMEKYDTIVCLSVTKWIHLNWGDDGIITLFDKIWRLLRPGGILLLEPQPWSSYRRKRLVSGTSKVNFEAIFLHPNKFREILLDKIGFRSAEVVTDKLSGTVTGFDRPIFAFCK